MVNDTISDMLTRLRNAYLAKKTVVVLKATRTVKDIAQVLAQEGFLGPIENEANGFFTFMRKMRAKLLCAGGGGGGGLNSSRKLRKMPTKIYECRWQDLNSQYRQPTRNNY